MAEKQPRKEDIAGIEYYGFDSEDLFPGAKDKVDKPIDINFPETTKKEEKLTQKTVSSKIIENPKDNKPLLREEDIIDIIKVGPDNPLSSYDKSKKPPSNVIKKTEVDKKHVLSPIDFKKEIERTKRMSNIDWSEIADEIDDSDFLNDDFLDFIELPKISGDAVNLVGKNLITSDFVKHTNKKVEISDESISDESHNHTSIEINRSETGDIESIAVYCKCGEVTQITFNYEDAGEIDNIEYFKTQSGMDSLNLDEVKLRHNAKKS